MRIPPAKDAHLRKPAQNEASVLQGGFGLFYRKKFFGFFVTVQPIKQRWEGKTF
jgi:hypothetical protein